jgi:tetratricopeptide (TPR) repeat protein
VGNLQLGDLLKDTGRPEDAMAVYKEAIVQFRQLKSRFADDIEHRHNLAATYNNLGLLHSQRGDFKRADEAYASAQTEFRQLADDFPSIPEYRHDLAASYHNLGELRIDLKQYKEAETAYREALRLYQHLVDGFPKRPEFWQNLGRAHNSMGVLFGETNKPDEAVAAYEKAVAIYEKLAKEYRSIPDYANNLAGSFGNLANQALLRRDFKSARKWLEEALPYHRAALAKNSRHPNYQGFYRNNLLQLIQAYGGTGDQTSALATATTLRDLGGDPPTHAYYSACGLALCATIVKMFDKSSPEDRAKAIQFYCDQSMRMLRDAIAKGFRDVAQLDSDPDIEPLRDRDDFKMLRAELENKAKARSKP